jgi:ribosome-associated protein
MIKKVNVKLKPNVEKEVSIKGEYIKLDSLLKYADIVDSGGIAKMIIQDEKVRVNGEICTERGRKLHVGDKAKYSNIIVKITGEKDG